MIRPAIFAIFAAASVHAEFLFAPADPTPNGFFTPTLDYENATYEYSAWDIFYAPHTMGNFPDVFAFHGGTEISPDIWAPVPRSMVPGFPAAPGIYNPGDPLAFWDALNPTITQTLSHTTFVIGPDIAGNIYTWQDKTAFKLEQPSTLPDGIGTAVFQFQTDGTNVDFSGIRLVYNDGFNDIEILATDAEYLREYHTTASAHWSASAGYANRVAIQWDLSGITDRFGQPIRSFEILWESQTSSMSFQKADLVIAEGYQAGIPISAAWTEGDGMWSNDANWSLHEPSGLTSPQENGNIKFQNEGAVEVVLDESFTLGELIFETVDGASSAGDVTITSNGGAALVSNTGVTTRAGASGTYTIAADFALGAVNFFEINDGTVAMNGVISGNHGLVKSGEGTLVLAGDNTFTQFLGIQEGTVRIEGTNAYTGITSVVNGTLIVAADAGTTGALGNSSGAITVGAEQDLYAYVVGSSNLSSWQAELLIDGDHVISRDIALAAGDIGKRLGAFNTAGGAVFSGNIAFTGNTADPDSDSAPVGNTRLTAQAASDRLIFSGSMTGGSSAKTVTVDGLGTVVFTGADKTYNTSTHLAGGTLLLDAGTAYTGTGNWTVGSGARLAVDGNLAGSGSLTLQGGGILSGTGTVSRDLTVADGAIIAPGNSPGTLDHVGDEIWGAGGIYEWEIGSTDSGAGLGWDLLNISGALQITAASSTPFEIRIVSLDASDFAGTLAGFDEQADYEWIIATASGGIVGFDGSYFSVNTGAFANGFTGFFGMKISDSGNDIVLTYTAVPEPSAGGMLLAGCLALWLFRRNQKRGHGNPKEA